MIRNTHVCGHEVPPKTCVCVRVCLVFDVCPPPPPPKKTSKQEKRKNMQQKYLRLAACSLKIHQFFLWADLGLRKKGGKKRKEKIQKRLLAKTEKEKKRISKKEKKQEQKRQISKSSCWVFFFFIKRVQKQKALQTQIYYKKRHKIKENIFFIPLFSPCRRKWLPLFVSLPFKLPSVVEWGRGEKGEIEKGGLKNRTQPLPPNLGEK